MMHRILVIGAGKIGSLISLLLADSKDYRVYLADISTNNPHLERLQESENIHFHQLDAADKQAVQRFMETNRIEAVVSSLPFYANIPIAEIAGSMGICYFDLTEDVATTDAVHRVAQDAKATFVPQCGLAPGFISIVANHLMQHFEMLDMVKMRVGALPLNMSNSLQYALTWSTDGLINEYGNPCYGMVDGQEMMLLPLEGLEEIKIDGLTYEAFNTSGGIGSLATSYHDKVRSMSYKTIRYPGHCAKIKFLMNDLKLNEDRDTLKRILERAIPKTYQDVVIVYVSVIGMQAGQLLEENYVKKFFPKTIAGNIWSAIQLTTATSLCTVVDLVMNQREKYQGFVRQETINLDQFLQNQFGKYYAE